MASGYNYKGIPIEDLGLQCPYKYKDSFTQTWSWNDFKSKNIILRLDLITARSLVDYYGNIVPCWGIPIWEEDGYFSANSPLYIAEKNSVVFPAAIKDLSAGTLIFSTSTYRYMEFYVVKANNKYMLVSENPATTFSIKNNLLIADLLGPGGVGGKGDNLQDTSNNKGIGGGGGGGSGGFCRILIDLSKTSIIKFTPGFQDLTDNNTALSNFSHTICNLTHNDGTSSTITCTKGNDGTSAYQDNYLSTYAGGNGGSVSISIGDTSAVFVLDMHDGVKGGNGMRIWSDTSNSAIGSASSNYSIEYIHFGPHKDFINTAGGQGETPADGLAETGAAGGGGGAPSVLYRGYSHIYPTDGSIYYGAGGCGQTGWESMKDHCYRPGGPGACIIYYMDGTLEDE